MLKRKLWGCAECPTLGKIFKLDNSSDGLNCHYRDYHWGVATFKCSVCGLLLDHKTSLIRHIMIDHVNEEDSLEASDEDVVPSTSTLANEGSSDDSAGGSNLDVGALYPFATCDELPRSSPDSIDPLPGPSTQSKDLSDVAGEVIMELRSTARLTGAAVSRFQGGFQKLLAAHTDIVKAKISAALKAKGIEEDLGEVINEAFVLDDPFKELKTVESQLKFYAEKYGLVIPEECFLGSRIDNRLDPKTNEYVPTQVSESFQYVSVLKTLTLVLSNKKIREDIFSGVVSEDDVLRSYMDGTEFNNHPFLSKFKDVLQLCLFYDDLEIAAALGSKTIVHKLGVFFFQILNGCAQLKSKLSSIHLLALAYSEDLKKPNAFHKVLFKFVQEMTKLGSEAGVEINLDGAPFTLRAVLVSVSADTLAAHELLGFLSPSAKHFCRVCMISRPIFREDGNAEAPLRTRAEHDKQVLEVKNNQQLSTQFGVKAECCLNQCPYFHCVDGSVFDAFHDLLEGVVPWVLKLVLRNLIYVRELFTVQDFNCKIASFSYGIPDAKNKPSANFMLEMLTTRKNLKQTGTQMWCLIRVFPFLVADYVPEGDEHMEVIFIVQDIMKVALSFEVSVDDLVILDSLIFKLLDNFKRLYVDSPNPNADAETIEDNIEDAAEDTEEALLEDAEKGDSEDSEDENEHQPGQKRKKRKKKSLVVRLFNKLHHLKHMVKQMKEKGPVVRLWCAKYEASLKIFRQYASICCNFKNPPKTMARMFQLSHLWSLISSEDESASVEFGSLTEISLSNAAHRNILEDAGITEFRATNKAIVNGEEYRPGLFLSFKDPQSRLPQFCIITDIYVVGESTAYLVLKGWTVNGLSGKYNAYQVIPNECSAATLKNVLSLQNFRPIAPWSSSAGNIYVSPRTQVL